MGKEMVSSNSPQNSKISDETPKRRPKKKLVMSTEEVEIIKAIAEKAKSLRESLNLGSEDFALKAGINRNTYFRFEQSAQTGENYTIAILLKVIRGLNMNVEEFFKGLR
jgi:DNA-binding XRE family transcriptional regulator